MPLVCLAMPYSFHTEGEPDLPVHLGSMSFAVRFQQQYLKGDIQEGDVIMTNHPVAGGSHLPDMTLITPVFDDAKIVFFTASRGHHADVGGILPGFVLFRRCLRTTTSVQINATDVQDHIRRRRSNQVVQNRQQRQIRARSTGQASGR
jgi:hypothetical protein